MIRLTEIERRADRPDDLSGDAHRRLIGWIGLLLPPLLIAIAIERDGVARDMVAPVRAVLAAVGGILDDHGFDGGLRGRCEIGDLGLLAPGEHILAEVLPGS